MRNGALVLHGFTGHPSRCVPKQKPSPMRASRSSCPFFPATAPRSRTWSPSVGRTGRRRPKRPMSSWRRVATRRWWWRCPWAGLWRAGWPSTTRRSSGLVLVNPDVEPPAESSRDVIRGIVSEGVELAPAVGSDIAKEGAVELAYTASSRCELRCLCSRASTWCQATWARSRARSSCSRAGRTMSCRPPRGTCSWPGCRPRRASVARAQLPRGHPRLDAPEIVDRTVAFVAQRFAAGSDKEVVAESAR